MISDADINYYMQVAELTALRSKAVRKKVGAVLVSTDRVMAAGYNGTPKGWDNACEETVDGALVTKPEVIHGEMNALFKFLNNGVSTKGAMMFMTLSPCVECAKAMYLASISAVYFRESYRSDAGVEFLTQNGIMVRQIP